MPSKRPVTEVYARWWVEPENLVESAVELLDHFAMSCGRGNRQWEGFDIKELGSSLRITARQREGRRQMEIEFTAPADDFLKAAGKEFWLSPWCFAECPGEESDDFGIQRRLGEKLLWRRRL